MTGSEIYSQAWADAVVAGLAAAPSGDGSSLDLRFAHTSTKGPDGDVRLVVDLQGGRLVSLTVAGDEAVELETTASWSDGLAMARGDLDVNVAFMSGRLKAVGHTGPLLEMVRCAGRPEVADALRRAGGDAG